MNRMLITIFFLIFILSAQAQEYDANPFTPFVGDEGPWIPKCLKCPTSNERPLPHSGYWYDPERSGSGMQLTIQGKMLAGTYYGFKESGEPVWYLFTGELILSDQKHTYWEVDADLYQFQGGSCIDCEYKKPRSDRGRKIHLKFYQRKLMTYQVEDGKVYRLIPLVFGTEMRKVRLDIHNPSSIPKELDHIRFPIKEAESYDSSDVATFGMPWMIIRRRNTEDKKEYNYPMAIMSVYKPETASHSVLWAGGTMRANDVNSFDHYWLYFSNIQPGGTYEPYIVGKLECSTADSVTFGQVPAGEITMGYMCGFKWLDKFYFVNAGDVDDSHFSGVAKDGEMIEGYRLMYH